jgi:uncharacterized membrane protein (Fun14 family)
MIDKQLLKITTGFGIGMGIGYYVLKSNNILFLFGVGVASAFLTNHYFPEKINDEKLRELQVEEDIKNSLILKSHKSDFEEKINED